MVIFFISLSWKPCQEKQRCLDIPDTGMATPFPPTAPLTLTVGCQTGKTAGEGDGMLDGDVLPLHDDPLNEQTDKPLAPGEVERLQATADGRSEGRDVGAQPLQARTIGVLSLQVFGSSAGRLEGSLQPLAPGLEFVYLDDSLLVGINESVNLPLQVLARPLQPCSVLLRSLRVLTAQRISGMGALLLGGGLLVQGAGGLQPIYRLLLSAPTWGGVGRRGARVRAGENGM